MSSCPLAVCFPVPCFCFCLLSRGLSIASFPGSRAEEPGNEARLSDGGTAIDSFPGHFLSSFVAWE